MNNYELVKQYRDVPPKMEDVKKLFDNVPDKCRYFLVGKLCLAERDRYPNELICDIYNRTSKEFGYSENGVRRYVLFAKAIDHLQIIAPEAVPGIIEGTARISIKNAIMLSKKSREEILKITDQLTDASLMLNNIFPEHMSCTLDKRRKKRLSKQQEPLITVKDTPEYDPDAQVSSLSYTIPSWLSAIDNVFMNTDFKQISPNARYRLRKELVLLIETSGAIFDIIKEIK
jgi:hypothetical protein